MALPALCLHVSCWGEVAQHCDLYLGAVERVATLCPRASLQAPKAVATRQEGEGMVQVGAVRLCPREAAEALCRAREGWWAGCALCAGERHSSARHRAGCSGQRQNDKPYLVVVPNTAHCHWNRDMGDIS